MAKNTGQTYGDRHLASLAQGSRDLREFSLIPQVVLLEAGWTAVGSRVVENGGPIVKMHAVFEPRGRAAASIAPDLSAVGLDNHRGSVCRNSENERFFLNLQRKDKVLFGFQDRKRRDFRGVGTLPLQNFQVTAAG